MTGRRGRIRGGWRRGQLLLLVCLSAVCLGSNIESTLEVSSPLPPPATLLPPPPPPPAPTPFESQTHSSTTTGRETQSTKKETHVSEHNPTETARTSEQSEDGPKQNFGGALSDASAKHTNAGENVSPSHSPDAPEARDYLDYDDEMLRDDFHIDFLSLLAEDTGLLQEMQPLLDMVDSQPKYPETSNTPNNPNEGKESDDGTTNGHQTSANELLPTGKSVSTDVMKEGRSKRETKNEGKIEPKKTNEGWGANKPKRKVRDYNYASYDCNAKVLDTNKEAERSRSILLDDNDRYSLNICSARRKYYVVQLCESIRIESIQVSNWEYFSSTFANITLSVALQYPTRSWQLLATFMADNIKGEQTFYVEDGGQLREYQYVKYVRVDIHSHHGHEHYCPLTQLKVYGVTMYDDYAGKDEAKEESTQSSTVEATVATAPWWQHVVGFGRLAWNCTVLLVANFPDTKKAMECWEAAEGDDNEPAPPSDPPVQLSSQRDLVVLKAPRAPPSFHPWAYGRHIHSSPADRQQGAELLAYVPPPQHKHQPTIGNPPLSTASTAPTNQTPTESSPEPPLVESHGTKLPLSSSTASSIIQSGTSTESSVASDWPSSPTPSVVSATQDTPSPSPVSPSAPTPPSTTEQAAVPTPPRVSSVPPPQAPPPSNNHSPTTSPTPPSTTIATNTNVNTPGATVVQGVDTPTGGNVSENVGNGGGEKNRPELAGKVAERKDERQDGEGKGVTAHLQRFIGQLVENVRKALSFPDITACQHVARMAGNMTLRRGTYRCDMCFVEDLHAACASLTSPVPVTSSPIPSTAPFSSTTTATPSPITTSTDSTHSFLETPDVSSIDVAFVISTQSVDTVQGTDSTIIVGTGTALPEATEVTGWDINDSTVEANARETVTGVGSNNEGNGAAVAVVSSPLTTSVVSLSSTTDANSEGIPGTPTNTSVDILNNAQTPSLPPSPPLSEAQSTQPTPQPHNGNREITSSPPPTTTTPEKPETPPVSPTTPLPPPPSPSPTTIASIPPIPPIPPISTLTPLPPTHATAPPASDGSVGNVPGPRPPGGRGGLDEKMIGSLKALPKPPRLDLEVEPPQGPGGVFFKFEAKIRQLESYAGDNSRHLDELHKRFIVPQYLNFLKVKSQQDEILRQLQELREDQARLRDHIAHTLHKVGVVEGWVRWGLRLGLHLLLLYTVYRVVSWVLTTIWAVIVGDWGGSKSSELSRPALQRSRSTQSLPNRLRTPMLPHKSTIQSLDLHDPRSRGRPVSPGLVATYGRPRSVTLTRFSSIENGMIPMDVAASPSTVTWGGTEAVRSEDTHRLHRANSQPETVSPAMRGMGPPPSTSQALPRLHHQHQQHQQNEGLSGRKGSKRSKKKGKT